LSRSTSFGRPVPLNGWQRGAGGRTGIRLWTRPTRAAAAIGLAALVIGNAVILYRLSAKADDPQPTTFPSGRSGQQTGGSFEDVGTALQTIQASIEARVEAIEPIDIEVAPSRDERRQSTSDRQAAPAGSASDSADRSGSSSTSPDSSGGSTSGGSTSGGSGSNDSADGTAGAGSTGGGGTHTGGSGGSTGDTGGTSAGAGGGGGGDSGSGGGTDLGGGGGGGGGG
jgi:hypothetical protein